MSSSTPPPDAVLPPAATGSWRRHPPGLQLWVGVGVLAVYLGIAISALVVFHGSDTLSSNPAWTPPWVILGPSWTYPFGILSGFGVNLVTALWQATPWDLAIIFSILALDAALGAVIGTLAGLYEGRWPDTLVTFVGDSLGSIPAIFLVVVVFGGLAVLAPKGDNLVLFVLLFGFILWPTCARIVRERARVLAHQPYVEAARAAGASDRRILLRHLLPNSFQPILAQLPIDLVAIYLVLSVFPWWTCTTYMPLPASYYVPTLPAFSPLPSPWFPEWGYLLGNGACLAFPVPAEPVYWWMFAFPLLAMVGLGLGLALLLDGIEEWTRVPM
ncbi:MAG: ABC transporter permease [Thermoplasmata archaeon]